MLHDPLFHMEALRPLSLFLQVAISAMSFCQGPENFCLHQLLCRENPDPENPVFKSYQKKNLEDKTSWRALIYMRALASHWTNIQQSKKKLVCRSNKSWPNLVSYLPYCCTFAYSSFYSPVQLKSRTSLFELKKNNNKVIAGKKRILDLSPKWWPAGRVTRVWVPPCETADRLV